MGKVRCRNCANYMYDWCSEIHDSPDLDLSRHCRYFRQKTNADKIRAMSDEELEMFLEDWRSCSGCMRRGNNCFPETVNVWLRQPAEGEEDD